MNKEHFITRTTPGGDINEAVMSERRELTNCRARCSVRGHGTQRYEGLLYSTSLYEGLEYL